MMPLCRCRRFFDATRDAFFHFIPRRQLLLLRRFLFAAAFIFRALMSMLPLQRAVYAIHLRLL